MVCWLGDQQNYVRSMSDWDMYDTGCRKTGGNELSPQGRRPHGSRLPATLHCSLTFESMKRGYDLSFAKGWPVLRLPDSAGTTFYFQFWKMLRRSAEAVVVLTHKECSQACAYRGVTECISAGQSVWVGRKEESPDPSSPRGRGPKTGTHDSTEHDSSAAGTPASGGNTRVLHDALLSRGRLSEQVTRYGG